MATVSKSTLAANNSNGSAQNTSLPFKDLSKLSLSKFPIADTPQSFLVSIEGEGLNNHIVFVEWLYNARHPYIALGEAMVKFYKNYYLYSIKAWRIAAPYIKQPRKGNNHAKKPIF